ncbi:MAG: hypothetical protein RJA52_591 [Bacteroidota bacterium]|jgi:hypothetical protein
MCRSFIGIVFFSLFSWTIIAQTGVIKGKITDKFNNQPIGFANVLVEGTTLGATTEDDGTFEITGIPPGIYDVTASFLGYNSKTEFEVQVITARPMVLDFALEESSAQLQEVVVKAEPFKKPQESPVSLRTIGITEINRNPGSNRDISKVIQSLPGVTSTVSFRNDLIIRGGSPNENRFFLDEVEVPNINHFVTQGASGGPVGLLNVNFIKEVDFYSGAFPANRGNALSSVFNFSQRDGRDDKIGSILTLGATDFGVILEGPLSDKTTFLFSARRSYLQFLFKTIGLPFLPTYNDFQFKVKYKPNEKSELTLIGLGALDEFSLNLEANETETQRFLLEQLPVTPQWNYTNGLVYKTFDDQGYWTFVVSRNMLNNEAFKYLDNDDSDESKLRLRYKSQEIENKLRIERTSRINDYRINFGVAYEFVKYNNSTFNRIFTGSGPQTINFSSDINFHKYGIFGQISRKYLNDRLGMSLGARMDANSYSKDMASPIDQFSPRFSLSYNFSDRFSFNFNTGMFYQLPPYTLMGYQQDGELINKQNGIRYIRNSQLVAGIEWNTPTSSRITVEGYYKNYSRYPFLLRDSLNLANLGGDFGVLGNEPGVSTSGGETYGIEVLFQQRLYKGFYGIMAYTLGWSRFEDKNNSLVPSSWDSRHIVSLTIGKKLKRDWEIGFNWRYQSGLPFTPFAANSDLVLNWQANGGGRRDFNRLNTERLGGIGTLDFRVDKNWYFKNWTLNLYFDVENATAAALNTQALILDRGPMESGIIVNPDAPIELQRYKVKTIDDTQGTLVPSIGIRIDI